MTELVHSKESEAKVLDVEYDFKSIADALYILIQAYSSVSVSRENWLTRRQSEFYVAYLISHMLDYDIYSKEADKIFEPIFGKHRTYDRKQHLKDLVKKNWAKQAGGEIELPDLFKGLSIDEGQVRLNINIKWG